MNLEIGLSSAEIQAIHDRVWKEEVESALGPRGFSFFRVLFRQSLLAGEKDLEKRGLLQLFRRTQQLPDYNRAEDAIRRGWATYAWQEFGIGPKDEKDYQKVNAALELWKIGVDQTPEERQETLRGCARLNAYFKGECDKEFARKLSLALSESPRKREGYRLMIHRLLNNWLTAFWWLMPLKSVACDMDATEGKADAFERFYQALRKATTRKTKPSLGAFFSAGYNGVFYSTKPTLIEQVNPRDQVVFTSAGLGCSQFADF